MSNSETISKNLMIKGWGDDSGRNNVHLNFELDVCFELRNSDFEFRR
jgi:hypothetical protein